jgi:sensor histidine kinase YesM
MKPHCLILVHMLWRVVFIVILVTGAGKLFAQDTIVFNTQPQWLGGLSIADKCWFYEETSLRPLSFDEVQKQAFVPYDSSLRQQRFSNRPLIIQWLRVSISNVSATDTLHLFFSPGPHVYISLYDYSGLLARSGIYETTIRGIEKGNLPLNIHPQTTKTFWIRTEDRSNMILPGMAYLNTPYTLMKSDAEGRYYGNLLFLLLAIVTGSLFFITLFAAYQYYLYKDKVFLWYIAYTSCSVLTGIFFIDIRFSADFLSGLFHDIMFSVLVYLIPVLYSLFIGNMLKLPQQFKKTWMVVKILIGIAVLQMLIQFITYRTGSFLFPDQFGYFVSPVFTLILNFILLVLTPLSKEKVKWFLFAGLLSMLLLWSLPVTGILNKAVDLHWGDAWNNFVTFPPFFLLLGLCVEAVCFSFALAYRSKLVLVERNTLQQQYNEQLQHELEKRTAELGQKNKQVEDQKIKQVQTAFEQKIAETEMNCLNSIKLYTLENDSETASGFLSMFSQLIRLVLENSRSEKITLEKELETLRLYIELEAMRFKEKVKYRIQVSPEIDMQYTELPPLLIQPYVENAIWHGLMHKKEGGTITIDITQPAENFLEVVIQDDGVGRKQAALYKSKSATKQKSFGLKMTSERIEMINQVYGIKATVEVEDLKDDKNNVTGTKVVIKIPV